MMYLISSRRAQSRSRIGFALSSIRLQTVCYLLQWYLILASLPNQRSLPSPNMRRALKPFMLTSPRMQRPRCLRRHSRSIALFIQQSKLNWWRTISSLSWPINQRPETSFSIPMDLSCWTRRYCYLRAWVISCHPVQTILMPTRLPQLGYITWV